MKRLILQHWDKDPTEVVELSRANIARYADRIGAEYRMLTGYPFDPDLSGPCQKLHMLSEEFDDYDTVVMFDSDMFTVTDLLENIFDVEGCGWHHAVAHSRMTRRRPAFASLSHPFWGGAVYRLPLSVRVLLRTHLPDVDLASFNSRYAGEDEGVMHYLATLAGMSEAGAYFPNDRWCRASFDRRARNAAVIHLRHTIRSRPGVPGNGRYRIDNYRILRDQGVIE